MLIRRLPVATEMFVMRGESVYVAEAWVERTSHMKCRLFYWCGRVADAGMLAAFSVRQPTRFAPWHGALEDPTTHRRWDGRWESDGGVSHITFSHVIYLLTDVDSLRITPCTPKGTRVTAGRSVQYPTCAD